MAKRPPAHNPWPSPGPVRRNGAAQSPVTWEWIPDETKVVVVFGGSFDPPHRYHTQTPFTILTEMFKDSGWLLFVPAAKSPLKGRGPMASDSRRIDMLKLALRTCGRGSIWTDEIDRARWQRRHGIDAPSYTIDTLKRLKTILPRGTRMRLLIGADQAASFHKWRECRQVIRLAEPIVMPRGHVTTARQLAKTVDSEFWTPKEKTAWSRRLAPVAPLPESSTSIRELIPTAPATSRQWRRRKGLKAVNPAVAVYIMMHRLYGFRPTSPAS